VIRPACALFLVAALAGLAGCAAAPRERPGPTTPASTADEQELARAHEDLRRADAELRAAAAQAPAPDCARIGELRDNICALAARICQIADRQPAGSPAADQCSDGKARCKGAIDGVQARGCPPKK
jgi:hypothetical protein